MAGRGLSSKVWKVLPSTIALVLGAILSNLGEIRQAWRGEETVSETVSGYRPTGDFRTEFEIYLALSGARANAEHSKETLMESTKDLLAERHSQEEVAALIQEASDEAVILDKKLSDLTLSLYEKYYTVGEIQHLNRFYSTQTMRDMLKKEQQISAELAPETVRLIDEFSQRYVEKALPIVMGAFEGEVPTLELLCGLLGENGLIQ